MGQPNIQDTFEEAKLWASYCCPIFLCEGGQCFMENRNCCLKLSSHLEFRVFFQWHQVLWFKKYFFKNFWRYVWIRLSYEVKFFDIVYNFHIFRNLKNMTAILIIKLVKRLSQVDGKDLLTTRSNALHNVKKKRLLPTNYQVQHPFPPDLCRFCLDRTCPFL